MPLYHSTAFVLCLFPCLVAGCTIALGHKFSNKTFWPEVRESNATVIQYVGETCRYLLAAPPQLDPVTGEDLDKKNKVRTAFGNGLRPDVWEKFKERFGVETIAEFYSATEGPSASFNLSSNTFATGAIGRFGTVAKLLTGSKMAIVALDWEAETPHRDPKNNNFCTRVPVGHQGELIYALDANDIKSKFQGYFKNEKATESKILRNVFTKGDAWFRTGDVMKLDEEGRMWFCDRIGDTFRWRSENVSTNEVSEVLGNHPSVDEANVYGVEVPKHDGRAGCVAITFNTDPTPALLKSIAEHTIKRLPKYAVPLFLRITKVVRTTGNNKQQKHVLRNEGIDLAKVDRGDSMFWLKDGTYVPFQEEDLSSIKAGQVRL